MFMMISVLGIFSKGDGVRSANAVQTFEFRPDKDEASHELGKAINDLTGKLIVENVKDGFVLVSISHTIIPLY